MPPASTALSGSPPAVAPRRASISGWGGGEPVPVSLVRPAGVDGLRAAIDVARSRGAIPRGLGRSYGDAAQLSNGLVLETAQLKRFELDHRHGTVTAQAGVTIGELLSELVPAGWMVPVVPGTQHVTVGGAIASDIHGKNHGTAGTLGSHVRALGLLTSAGELLQLEPGAGDGLFEATLGGMGLTGVVVWARIELRPVRSPLLSVDSDRVAGLDEAFCSTVRSRGAVPGGVAGSARLPTGSGSRDQGAAPGRGHRCLSQTGRRNRGGTTGRAAGVAGNHAP